MKEFRYNLEKYTGPKSRYECPRCNDKHSYTRYIDNETGEYIDDKVGRCNHESGCGFHYSPKEYFRDNKIKPKSKFIYTKQNLTSPPTSYLPNNLINDNYSNNHLYNFLIKHFDKEAVNNVLIKYRVGSSYKWPKSTVFYQFDKLMKCRAGKIMQYSPETGKRIKKPYNRISWLHSSIKDFNLKQCLFGEHLVRVNDNTPIGIIESEKTALIMALTQPEYIWLATGGLSNLNKDKVSGLGSRKIVLFPDKGCADKWNDKVKGTNAQVSYGLEDSTLNIPDGFDWADLIISTQ